MMIHVICFKHYFVRSSPEKREHDRFLFKCMTIDISFHETNISELWLTWYYVVPVTGYQYIFDHKPSASQVIKNAVAAISSLHVPDGFG